MSHSHGRQLITVVAAALAIPLAAVADNIELKPADLQWKPLGSLPKGAQLAMLYGDPTKAGPYAYRVKFPPNYRVMPHTHPDNRTYTFLAGEFHEADGTTFDESKLKAFPAGSFATYTGNSPHFGLTRGDEVILQVNGMGPTGIAYLDPADDPRKK